MEGSSLREATIDTGIPQPISTTPPMSTGQAPLTAQAPLTTQAPSTSQIPSTAQIPSALLTPLTAIIAQDPSTAQAPSTVQIPSTAVTAQTPPVAQPLPLVEPFISPPRAAVGVLSHSEGFLPPMESVSPGENVCLVERTVPEDASGVPVCPNQLPPFLRLPAELRNTIYRYALVEQDNIKVGVSGFSQPPLLRSCKQIRRESLKIYFHENIFELLVVDCNSDIIFKFTNPLGTMDLSGWAISRLVSTRESVWHYAPNWENLLTWLERFYSDTVCTGYYHPSECPPEYTAEQLVIGAMFCTTAAMDPLDWGIVKAVLEEQQQVLIKLDERWK